MYNLYMSTPSSFLDEMERLQRELQQAFGPVGRPGNIRAVASGTFPQVNVGTTPANIVIQVFVPGVDASALDLQVHRGVLTVSGERAVSRPQSEGDDKATVYATERFTGRFKRSVSLPDDADPAKVEAHYRDGVLNITVGRRESMQPRRIEIQ